uniref:Chromo domain-containing protein n=1 Tax=Glossina palpalis gambiensis TaxID=67801 RepID=A0A1B0BAC7_9MUSC
MKMVGREITPTEIGKHAKLIKIAQEEMAIMDVLVCGRCLAVTHFVEDFIEHKLHPCFKENNNVRECNDTKPKIWAFLLWKATQLNNNRDSSNSPNSWSLYQTWVKMDESMRETWIVAGKTIQSFAKVSQGNLQEMPVKITKTVVNNSAAADGVPPGRKPLTQTKPQVTNLKLPVKLPVNNKSAVEESEVESSPMKSPLAQNTLQKIIKKPITTSQIQGKPANSASNNISTLGKNLTRRAKRTVPNSDEIVEENVEKIVAKRFNPRRRMHEYLVKWESQTLQNTWEPASHLENVPHLLDTFEKQLARQKETRAALQAKQQAAANQGTLKPGETNNKTNEGIKKEIISTVASKNLLKTTIDTSSPSEGNKLQMASPSERPQRTSKTKALDQVKQWVSAGGSNASNSAANSPNSETAHATEHDKDWSLNNATTNLSAVKRKHEDSDSNTSDMPPSTTSTMEDLEEDLIPSHTLKRMKYGNAVSVEVKTKQDSIKQVKVNGTAGRAESSSNSAEVFITQDAQASGVVKKPGSGSNSTLKSEAPIRVLSKGETSVSNSGIVRITDGANQDTSVTTGATTTFTVINNQTETKTLSQLATRTQHVRVGAATKPNTQVRQGVQQQIVRTPSGTTIQKKTIPAGGSSTTIQRSGSSLQSRTGQQTTPSSGRMIIPRQTTSGNTGAGRTGGQQQKAVTPEQKILQLSKSGDLKVTRKVMTREDVMAQRASQQQQQQRQQQARQQSQIHIQKVQQLSGGAQRSSSGATLTRKAAVPSTVSVQQEEEHQAQLCPITGNIITPGGEEQSQVQNNTVIHAQTKNELQQHTALKQEQEQQLHDVDGNLLLSQDQMLTNEDGTPLLVTGEDGTVYQVAGKNAEGQTVLVTQGPDGEQQFAYVAAAEGENENQVLTLDNAIAEAVAQLPAEHAEAFAAAAAGESSGGGQYIVKTTQEDGTTQMVTMTEAELAQHQALAAAQQQQAAAAQSGNVSNAGVTSQLCIQTGDGSDGQEANIPAEVVQAELPSPGKYKEKLITLVIQLKLILLVGGTRRVVLLLQDGTFMMTEMHDDEFKALNIAA